MAKSLQDILNSFANGVSAKDFLNALRAEGFNVGNYRGNYNGKTGNDLSDAFKKEEEENEKKRQRDREYELANNKKKQEMLQKEMSEMDKRYKQLLKDEKDLSKTDDERIKAHEEINKLLDERNYKEKEYQNLNVKTIDKLKAGYNLLKDTYGIVKKFNDPWAKVDDASAKFARNIGLAKNGLENLRKNTIENAFNQKIGIKYDLDAAELIKLQEDYVNGIGRNVRVSNGEQESIAAMSKFVDVNEWGTAFDKFGVNIEDVGERVYGIFKDSTKSGLSFKKISQDVVKNISIAQNFTFKNGLDGLKSMAERSAAIKLDMQAVASLAGKVNSVEGAIDVASKLQVLGGPFANFADPMGMLNEGLNDIEGLQERMAKMIGGLGTFNKETGEVQVSAFNKRRIAEAANAMGVSTEQLMDSVNAQARRKEIGSQIALSKNAAGLDKDMKELIMNSGTFKEGKAGISINGQFKSIDELTNNDYEALVKETQTEGQDIKDIAQNVRSLVEKRSGLKKQKDIVASRFSEKTGLGKGESAIVNAIGHSNMLLRFILAAEVANAAVRGYMSFSTSIGGGKGFGNMGSGFGGITKIFSNIGKTLGNVGKGAFKSIGSVAKSVGKLALKGGSKALALFGGGAGATTTATLAAVGGVATAAIAATAIGRAIAKKRRTAELDGRLNTSGIERQGTYSPERLKKINQALETGEMSNRVKKSLLRKGDAAIVAQIENVQKQKEKEEAEKKEKRIQEREERKDRRVERRAKLRGAESSGRISNSVNSAFFNAESVKIMAKPENGKWEKIREKIKNKEDYLSDNKIGPTTFNLSINGTLKLEGKNGDSIDIIDSLKKDPQLLSQLTEMLKKKMLEIGPQAYVPGKKSNLYQV